MSWAFFALATVVAIVLFFAWANAATARAHARFGRDDIEAALHEFVSPDSEYHDDWDLFLSWPIDDPYCESVRQACLKIVRESQYSTPELDPEVLPKVAQILERVRHGA
jgi:hypothetical protein